jgi:AcrR family transcriptional regulator
VSTLTARGRATRARIVEGAAAQIREHGVADTTLDDIRDRTATSKSQLFHYFPGGKEELLLAVAEHEADRVLSDQQPHLGRLATWDDWQRWRDAVVRRYRTQGPRCPLAALNTELGRSSPAGRALTAQLFGQWAALLEQGLRTMQAADRIGPALDPARTAAALVAGIQGGVGILLATGDITALEATLDLMLDHIRNSAPTAAYPNCSLNPTDDPLLSDQRQVTARTSRPQ